MVRNSDGYELYLGDRVTAVVITPAQSRIIEGTIAAFRYQGLQVLIQTDDGTKYWCNALSTEAVINES